MVLRLARLWAFALFALFAFIHPAVAGEVFSDNFEAGAKPQWSRTTTEVTPAGNRRFLGRFGDEGVRLSLGSLPPHGQVTVTFDVYVIDTWDGNNTTFGPDIFEVNVAGGPRLLRTTFSNVAHSASPQAYPSEYPGGNFAAYSGAFEKRTLGYFSYTGLGGEYNSAVYRITKTFAHTGGSLAIDFAKVYGGAGTGDESWGLDNVNVRVDPLISDVRLSQPAVVNSSDPLSAYLKVTFYIKGIGGQNEPISGRWWLDNEVYAEEPQFARDLTSGSWVEGRTITIPWTSLQGGNHVLRFELLQPQSMQSGEMQVSVTGFFPSVNGWKFRNTKSLSDLLGGKIIAWNGVCIGMSRTARFYYYTGPIPSVTSFPRFDRNLYTRIISAHAGGAGWFETVGKWRLVYNYQSDRDALSGESDRLRDRIQSGDPCVMDVLQYRSFWVSQTAHAVVAIAAVYSNRVYTGNDVQLDLRRFYIYDPNSAWPQEIRQVDVFNYNGNWSMEFQGDSTYKFLVEHTQD